jgi:hypothetical protein
MLKKRNKVLTSLVLISIVVFALFCIPNSKGSENRAMVGIFEPDEAAIYDVIARMSRPATNLQQGLQQFINYDFYHYGFPFFGLSGALAWGLRAMGQFENTPLLMLVLRQFVSVLPMLAGLLILVWLQDGFKTWRSLALYLLLLLVPAVSFNGTWLHPDGLVIFLSALVIFFLVQDKLRFGKHFYWAAAFCGVLTAAKLVGVYFFLTILSLLLWGLHSKRLNLKQAVLKSLAFLAIMGLAFVLSNPFLFCFPSLKLYLYTLRAEFQGISSGYGLVYETGLSAALPWLTEAYGQLYFLCLALIGLITGAFRGPKKLTFAIILTWSIPLSVMLLTGTHFKYQYWLPVGLPLISSLAIFLPGWGNPSSDVSKSSLTFPRWMQTGALALVILQTLLFSFQDAHYLIGRTQRARNNPAIASFQQVEKLLNKLDQRPLHIYYDYRLYFPDQADISSETSFEMLQQGYIDEGNFDLLYIQKQRIRDYMNLDASGINPDQLSASRVFYYKLDTDNLPGYLLIYEDPVAKLFVRESLCSQFPNAVCPTPQRFHP